MHLPYNKKKEKASEITWKMSNGKQNIPQNWKKSQHKFLFAESDHKQFVFSFLSLVQL